MIKQFSFSFIDSQIYNIYLSIENSDIDSYKDKISCCFDNYLNVSEILLTKCFIKETKNDIDSFIEVLKNETMYSILKNIVPDKIIKDILSVLEDSIKKNNSLVDDIKDSLKYKDNLNLTLLDYIENIIDNLQNISAINYDIIFGNFSQILKNEAARKVINYFLDNNPELFLAIIQKLLPLFSELNEIFKASISVDSFNKSKTEIIPKILKIFINFNNKTMAKNLITEIAHQYKDVINDLLKNEKFRDETKKLLKIQQNPLNSIIFTILDKKEVIEHLQALHNFQDLFIEGINLLINFDNNTYIMEKLPLFLNDIKSKAKDFLPYFLRDILLGAVDYYKREVFLEIYHNALSNFFISHDIYNYNIKNNCIGFFNNSFFDNPKTREFTLKNLRKFLFDSPMSKGNFLGFDNCLEAIEDKDYNTSEYNYTLTPAFIIGIFDFLNKSNYLNTSYYEKYYYISNFCIPFAYRINDSGEDEFLCNKSDYEGILRFIYDLVPNSKDINITALIMYSNNIKLETKDYFIGIFTLIFLAIP